MKDYKKICENCACLVEKNKTWCCDELFGQPCSDADECPYGIQAEEITTIEEKAKETKIDHGVSNVGKKTDKKPRTTKVSDEKTEIFEYLTQILPQKYDIVISKPNKLIEISYNGKKFKLDLIETRATKKV